MIFNIGNRKKNENIRKDFQIQKLELEKEELKGIIENKEAIYDEMILMNKEKDKELKLYKMLLNKYYNLYDTSAIIHSIYDINNLVKYVNESILNIVEADYSSVILFDLKGRTPKIEATNIHNPEQLKALNDNINDEIITETAEGGSIYAENTVGDNEYKFLSTFGIESFCCMPITTINKKYGIILLESTQKNKFDVEMQKIISSIGYTFAQCLENLQLYKRISELATMDGLTGVYNRRYFQESISKEVNLALEGKYELSLIMFDIDHFKKINDTYSHQVGDKVLQSVCEIAKQKVHKPNILARYGGEEFAIIMPGVIKNEAANLAEEIRAGIEAMEIPDRRKIIKVTVSFGVASCPENANSESNLIKVTDRALYNAKDSGRNCVRVSEEKI